MFFQNFTRLQNELDNLFSWHRSDMPASVHDRSYPAVNIFDYPKEKYFVVKAELPGVKKENLELQILDDNVIIKGEREWDKNPSVNYHRQERSFGKFEREFKLPFRVNPEKVLAEFEEGILTIKLEKSSESQLRTIPIK